MMETFKGIKAFQTIAAFVLVMQMLKLTHFIHFMSCTCVITIVWTIGMSIKLAVFDKNLKDAKYWLLICILLIQEIVLGLDSFFPTIYYNLIISCMLVLSIATLYYLDFPSVRRHMDDDAYAIKSAIALFTETYGIAIACVIIEYMIPSHIPM